MSNFQIVTENPGFQTFWHEVMSLHFKIQSGFGTRYLRQEPPTEMRRFIDLRFSDRAKSLTTLLI